MSYQAWLAVDDLQQQALLWGGPCYQGRADALHTCQRVPGASEIVKVCMDVGQQC